LDQLTKEFFSNKFPGFKKEISIPKDVLETNVPVVAIPLDIDTKYLLSLAKTLEMTQHIQKTYPYEKVPRMLNWFSQILWSEGTVSPFADIYYKKILPPCPVLNPVDNILLIKKYIENFGISINLCILSKFGPNGYVAPHRDISFKTRPLGYFWLPLNMPIGSELKVYPTGSIDVKLGNLYLLNQENFVHAFRNNSDEDRYVILGYIKSAEQPLTEKIKKEILANYH